MIGWVRLRNYCEKRPESVTDAINSLLPPFLKCPFKSEKEKSFENSDIEPMSNESKSDETLDG